ncbi:E3 ubiquitin-protein ligase RNF187 [Meles meles]|uniref:E3 ubiquitin-protein ligase RNF187 n=1 Tax=Meles meles TaxID=9662 RepID=UPI001E6A0F6A|nr:E3 ubiquitin-protein ligase RNF187 [Meles meles]
MGLSSPPHVDTVYFYDILCTYENEKSCSVSMGQAVEKRQPQAPLAPRAPPPVSHLFAQQAARSDLPIKPREPSMQIYDNEAAVAVTGERMRGLGGLFHQNLRGALDRRPVAPGTGRTWSRERRGREPRARSTPLPGPGARRPAVAVPAPRGPVAILVPALGSPAAVFILVPAVCRVPGLARPPAAPSPRAPAAAALALPAGPAEASCALCQRAPREPVRADCGHRFCRACVVRFWAEDDGPFPCPECADDCWQRAVEPGRPPLSRRLLALEEAAAAPARDGPASEAALQLLCRADGGPLCAACRMAAGPEPPEWEPRWRKALRGKENKGSVEIMRKDLKDARDLHGQAESAAAVWKGHVMDRRKKALTDYRKLRAFFAEEEERFLQEAEKEEGSLEDEDADPADRFGSLLQVVSELERRHRSLGLSMLLQ